MPVASDPSSAVATAGGSVRLSEGAKPSKLLVSGKSDLAGDVTAQFEPAEPYEFIK